MNVIIRNNLDKIREVCEKHFILSLYVFGSVTTNKFNNRSDIDLLVAFKPMDYAEYADNYFATVEQFEKIFNRSVDLVTENSLKNPYFIQSVNQSKTMLYGN